MKNIFTAEFTTNHMGNFNILIEMTKKAKDAGASFIKMQKKDIETFYTKEKLNSQYESVYGHTYRDYRKIFEFEKEDFDRFDRLCKSLDMPWFATAQDINSLMFLLQYDLPMYKLASCNSDNEDLLEALIANVPKDKTIVCSIAGQSLDYIESLLNKLSVFKHVHLLHCVAEYPCSIENLRLGNIIELKKRFESSNVLIGYSGHEEGYIPTLAAMDLGATMIEKHFTLSRNSFVHHIECSLEPQEFEKMILVSKEEQDLKSIYNKYLVPESFNTKFSMSDLEKKFLKNNVYSSEYL